MFKLTRSEQIAIVSIVVVLVGISLVIYMIEQGHRKGEIEIESNIKTVEPVKYSEPNQEQQLTVHISGEVKRPGAYVFSTGSCLSGALERAEVKSTGYTKHLNKAEILRDGQKIYVPADTVARKETQGSLAAPAEPKMININIASAEELESLPGIGKVIAQRIIEYRKIKKFRTIEEITRVKGIAVKKFQKMKDRICVK